MKLHPVEPVMFGNRELVSLYRENLNELLTALGLPNSNIAVPMIQYGGDLPKMIQVDDPELHDLLISSPVPMTLIWLLRMKNVSLLKDCVGKVAYYYAANDYRIQIKGDLQVLVRTLSQPFNIIGYERVFRISEELKKTAILTKVNIIA